MVLSRAEHCRAGGVIGPHAAMMSSALRRVVPRFERKAPPHNVHVNVHHVGGFSFKLGAFYFAVRGMQNKWGVPKLNENLRKAKIKVPVRLYPVGCLLHCALLTHASVTHFMYFLEVEGREWCRIWFRHCATRRMVPVSIPGRILGDFQVTYPFCLLSVVLGSTKPEKTHKRVKKQKERSFNIEEPHKNGSNQICHCKL